MPKVLIADDREENRYVLVNFFKLFGPNSNIQIYETDNSKTTVELIKKEKPELVLLDIRMETDDAGILATKKIREDADPVIKKTQIWAITAQAMEAHDNEESDKTKCLNAGCDDYIMKPFDPVDLLKKASNYLKIEIPEYIKKKMGIG